MRSGRLACCAAFWLALTALAAHVQAQLGSRSPDYQRPGDPPRVAAKLFFEYRHLQAYSEEYNQWVADNIRALRYDTVPGALLSRWEEVQSAATRTEVVLVTQSTVSRLRALQMVSLEWKGPLSAAIYIELPASDPGAAECRERVTAWLRENIIEAWPTGAAQAPPLAISYLHANEQPADASCELPGPNDMDGGERAETQRRSAQQARVPLRRREGATRRRRVAARFGQTTVPQYLLHRFDNPLGRRLRGTSVENSAADALSGGAGRGLSARPAERPPPGLKPVWHAQPNRPGSYILPTEKPWREVYDTFYPVNTLRNLAWSQVPSGAFVFLSDIDFVPTPNLYSDLTSGQWRSEMEDMRTSYESREERRVLVVPAFELLEAKPEHPPGSVVVPYKWECLESDGCVVMQGMKIPRSFQMLRIMVQRTAVGVFHRKKNAPTHTVFTRPWMIFGRCPVNSEAHHVQFAPGHGCYSWLSWFQDEAPAKMLSMEYRHQCEPYVIALSDAMPRYDERFRGRGLNKIEQLTHMAAWGFKWKLLPAHFVLHIPHETSEPQAEGNWDVETTPIALMNVEMREIQREPQFRQHVPLELPSPIGTH